MRRFYALLVCLALLSASALAEDAPQILDDMTARAKDALVNLANQDWGALETSLNWSGDARSAGDWSAFAAGFDALSSGNIQTEVSVAFIRDGAWVVAVPVAEPNSDSAEALVLLSTDGVTFRDAAKASWGSVMRAVDASSRVIWDVEYIPSGMLIQGDE